MFEDVERILFHRDQIQIRVAALGREIAAAYSDCGDALTLVPVLSGSIIFLADLIRCLPMKMKIALVHVSTYPGKSTSPQAPKTVLELTGDVSNRHVLIVDDILDSGRTLRRVQEMLAECGPATIRTAVLLRKPGKAPPDVRVDFVGFDVEDQFVVGYGLDFDDHYRNYPHIGVLRPECLA
ncbi:Hypoxanthine phosphoribosyltransferase [Phycisphaerae bacterium RAS1]|nr:Hypoxanthine phosphoribosyltransferase [Phycisphaerae bacterium RAS1]